MKLKIVALLCLASVLTVACMESPLGRKQLLLMPASQMDQMGATAYAQMKEQQPTLQTGKEVTYVRCIADAITDTLGTNQSWEVNVFKDDSANAFALPGGKIGVHTGLLNVAKTPDQLAAVIGHEIGHVMAQHSNERMSIQMATQTGMQLLQVMSGEQTQEKQMIFGLLGLGTQVGVSLPFSRKHETEADLIGLKLMAQAGFDPRASVDLWQNMAKASGGAPPEFLSTHPSSQSRIEELRANMAGPLQTYNKAQSAGRTPQCSR
jgi:predicted Zn-dependent protease